MAKIVEMTQLSPTMTEGVLAKWRKNEGDKVGPGDVLAEVETDKANMELEAFDKGVLLAKLATEGTPVKVGAAIGIIGAVGEDVTALIAQAKAASAAAPQAAAPQAATPQAATPQAATPQAATPQAATPQAATPQAASPQAPAAANGRPAPAPQASAPAPAPAPQGGAASTAATSGAHKAPPAPQRPSGERVLASPLARALAVEKGVDVAQLSGSGPHGRVVMKDVEAATSQPHVTTAPSSVSFAVPSGPEFDEIAASPMRKTIAQRLTEAKRAPEFYLTVECDAAPLKAFRAQANDGVQDAEKVSLNDLIVKCVARALRLTPLANASYLEQNGQAVVRRWKRVHVGIAVALEDGLITPTIRDADVKPLYALAAEAKDLIARARVKKLKAEEYSGATISVSNLGMMGIEEFTAILNPPGSTILAVGAVVSKPVVAADGKSLVVGERMRLTLTCDHRVVDELLGATLLGKIKDLVEHPIRAVL